MILHKPNLLLGYGRLGQKVVAFDKQSTWITVRKHKINPVATITAPIENLSLIDLPSFNAVVYACAPYERSTPSYELCFIHNLKKILTHLRFDKFIFCSSSVVFEENSGQFVDEASPTSTVNFRQYILLEAEKLVQLYAWKNFSIFRLSGLYDSMPAPTSLWEQQDNWANRIHLDDAASMIIKAVHLPHSLQDVFCLTDDHPFVPKDIAHLFKLEQSPLKKIELSSKRILNLKMKSILGSNLLYPTIFRGYQQYLLS
ncbi:hypothetical protein EBR43_09305 [bacterium]|jgi:nucleoside-diphosphate-sugar epimerase|nr:hypothetical protein [bacterium]NBX72312.1 hypothetical protein [bacterium]